MAKKYSLFKANRSLFEYVDTVPVFKLEEIGLADSLPSDDGTPSTAEPTTECIYWFRWDPVICHVKITYDAA